MFGDIDFRGRRRLGVWGGGGAANGSTLGGGGATPSRLAPSPQISQRRRSSWSCAQ